MLLTLAGLPILVPLLRRYMVQRPQAAPYVAAAIMAVVTVIASFFGHKHISFAVKTPLELQPRSLHSSRRISWDQPTLAVTRRIMKAVILAGGLGSRLSEETSIRPKPMVEIGGQPILWHILKIYSHYGINDFIICLGYKGYVIKEYFANYLLHSADVTIDLQANRIETHESDCEPWRVTLIDTGADTMTGGRLKRILPYVKDEEMFCFTYGDGVSDVNISSLIDFHRRHGKAGDPYGHPAHRQVRRSRN